MRLPHPPLLVVTDRAMALRPLGEVASAAFAGGCRWIMVREKDLPEKALAELVAGIVSNARRFGASVSVNGNAGVAARCGAQGVHLPQGYSVAGARGHVGDDALIGVSAHSREEAERASADGTDYVTLSPIFPTASKPGHGPALGLDGLKRVAEAVAVPVVALGGVTAENAGSCLEAGAAGVAVMGALMRAADPADAAAEVLDRLTAVPKARWRGGCRS